MPDYAEKARVAQGTSLVKRLVDMTTELPELTAETPMGELLRHYPGAQRALFARYHIGGCQSCGFSPEETLAQVCERNEDLPVGEVAKHIQESHDSDQKISIEPKELGDLLKSACQPRLIDIRTREEYEAVNIPGARLYSQELLQEVFGTWDKELTIVLYDHTGGRSMDATAYFIGHGFGNARALRGGIDAYSQEVDSSLPRYRVEMEDA